MNKVTYCEDIKWQYFAIIDSNQPNKDLYPKQVEFENVPKTEIEYLLNMDIETDEIREKIKKIIKAYYG